MLATDNQKKILKEMLRIRIAEERIAEEYAKQEMRCPVHLCIGQEAPPVGVCLNLNKDDAVFSTHRAHGHYLAKGGSLKAMLAEIYGKVSGCAKGNGGSMHLIDKSAGFLGSTSIVAGTIPVAVGAAFGFKLQERSQVVVVFFGDAATEEGLFHESINFAAVHSLPIIFVCENNLYSIYTSLKERQPNRRLADQVRGYGISSLYIDGNDVVSVYETAQSAVNKVRQGGGPFFLEMATYRWLEHCGPNYDNNLGYRTEQECEEWKKRCPIQNLRHRLLEQGAITLEEVEHMAAAINEEVNEAFEFARSSPFPQKEQLHKNIYAEESYGRQAN